MGEHEGENKDNEESGGENTETQVETPGGTEVEETTPAEETSGEPGADADAA